ncbi:hypothetical protein EDB86DRAFT_3070968 [Lactarius hatsudake]|nr:hypothetical protein EDB86DRAFT_3070968 [Lactarius hatsudake]
MNASERGTCLFQHALESTSNTSATRPGLDQPSEGSSRPSSPAEPNGSPPALVPRINWQFPRNPSRLPDFEPNITTPEHSPPPMHQSPIHNTGSTKPSHIPVRSPGRVPKIKLKQNGDAKEFMKGHKRATTEFAEANGAIPPRVRIQSLPGPELESASELENLGVKSSQAPIEPSSDASSLPTSPQLALSTPPRPPSVSTSRIGFRAPSPPEGLPELPGPPSEDDTGDKSFATRNNGGLLNLNLTTAKTPRAPGAWTATPAPAPARSQTPQPILSSIGHSRTRSNSLPQPSFTEIRSSMATPASALTHAGTLPGRTPAPPGGWLSTPGSLRRRSLMKVRFETTPSGPTHGTSESISEPSFNNVESSSPVLALSTSASGDGQNEDGPVALSQAARPPSPRKLRRTPSVRLVDEYGRAKEDFPSTPSRKDVRDHSASMRMPGGGPLKTPRNASVRILDAMGHELEEPSEPNDSEDTVTEARYTRQEALDRMKKAVADLREGLNSVDISGNGSLDDPRLGELYDLSKAARDMRSKLASSLQQAQSAQIRHKYGSLKDSMRKSRFLISSIVPQVPIPSALPPPYPDFSPSPSDIRVIVYWFMSLVFSLSAALLATLVEQWSARLRQYLYESVEGWCMPVVAESVPGLVRVTVSLLATIFLGLSDSLLALNTTIGITTIVPINVILQPDLVPDTEGAPAEITWIRLLVELTWP